MTVDFPYDGSVNWTLAKGLSIVLERKKLPRRIADLPYIKEERGYLYFRSPLEKEFHIDSMGRHKRVVHRIFVDPDEDPRLFSEIYEWLMKFKGPPPGYPRKRGSGISKHPSAREALPPKDNSPEKENSKVGEWLERKFPPYIRDRFPCRRGSLFELWLLTRIELEDLGYSGAVPGGSDRPTRGQIGNFDNAIKGLIERYPFLVNAVIDPSDENSPTNADWRAMIRTISRVEFTSVPERIFKPYGNKTLQELKKALRHMKLTAQKEYRWADPKKHVGGLSFDAWESSFERDRRGPRDKSARVSMGRKDSEFSNEPWPDEAVQAFLKNCSDSNYRVAAALSRYLLFRRQDAAAARWSWFSGGHEGPLEFVDGFKAIKNNFVIDRLPVHPQLRSVLEHHRSLCLDFGVGEDADFIIGRPIHWRADRIVTPDKVHAAASVLANQGPRPISINGLREQMIKMYGVGGQPKDLKEMLAAPLPTGPLYEPIFIDDDVKYQNRLGSFSQRFRTFIRTTTSDGSFRENPFQRGERTQHGLRATGACAYAEAGVNMLGIMILLGDRTTAAAKRYVALVRQRRIVDDAFAKLLGASEINAAVEKKHDEILARVEEEIEG